MLFLAMYRSRWSSAGQQAWMVCAMLIAARGTSPTEPTDYCHDETFSATCAYDEVIMMTSATYGRMRMGRCVKVDMGFIGCHKDVLDLVDERCSGRRKCSISVPDRILEKLEPCLELKSYLQASYTCVKVIPVDVNQCQGQDFVRVGPPSGVIASEISRQTWCGTSDTPWVIQAEPGQRINITIVDFSHNYRGGDRPGDYNVDYQNIEVCEKYAMIREKTPYKDIMVCGGKQREHHIYLSNGNKVEIRIENKRYNPNYFLLKYNVVGCPDPKLSGNAWFRRESNDITIGCNGSDDTWRLNCVANIWVGDVGNCSDYVPPPEQQTGRPGGKLPKGVIAAIVTCVALIVCLTVVVLGIVFVKRYRRPKPNVPATVPSGKTIEESEIGEDEVEEQAEEEAYLKPTQESQGSTDQQRQERRSDYQKAQQLNKNDYTHIWEMPLPKTP